MSKSTSSSIISGGGALLDAPLVGAAQSATSTSGVRATAGRRTTLAALSFLLAAALLLAALAASAQAKQIHKLDSSLDGSDTPAGSFAGPDALAVHQGDDLLYAIDAGNGAILKYDVSDPTDPQLADFSSPAAHAITEYDDDGNAGTPDIPLSFGVNTELAVDASGGPNDGTIYVAIGASSSFATDGKLFAFSAAGDFLYELTAFGDSVNATGVDVVDEGERAGDLYVYANVPFSSPLEKVQRWIDQSGGAAPVYDADTSFPPAGFPFGPNRIAVADAGATIYAPPGVSVYTPDGTVGTKLENDAAGSLAANPDNGYLYSAGSIGLFGGGPTAVREYSGAIAEPANERLDTFGADAMSIALRPASNTVYASDPTAHEIDIYVPGEAPDVTVGEGSFDTLTSAELTGTVNPLGAPVSTCEFQYGPTTNYGQSVSCDPANLGNGEDPVDVSGIATGLTGGTLYHYRLKVTNGDGANVSEDATYFAPNLPEATTSEAGPTGARSGTALLGGTVDANKTPTSWWIEYGTEADLSDAQSSPASEDLEAGDGNDPIDVAHKVSGLEPETTYYFRVVAATPAGSALGGIKTLTMPAAPAPDPSTCPNADFRNDGTPSSGLPNCRAYERVTPADTNGGSVVNGYDITTIDGDRVTYAAETAFGGQQSMGLLGAYVAGRSPEGWTSEGIQPPVKWGQSATGIAGWLPQTPDPELEDFFISGTDMDLPGVAPTGFTLAHREPGSGEWSVLLQAASQAQYMREGWLAVMATDVPPMAVGTTPPPGRPGIYALSTDGAEAHLLSVDEAGSPISGPDTGDGVRVADVSTDGSRVFFNSSDYTPSTSGTVQNLWVRIDNAESKMISKSEVNPVPPTDQPVRWEGATPDGKYAFFTSSVPLTADSTSGGIGAATFKLYRYDVDSGDLVDLTTTDLNGPGVEGMIGVSDDGSVAYIQATGNLTAAASGSDSKIYRIEADPTDPGTPPEIELIADHVVVPVGNGRGGPGTGSNIDPDATKQGAVSPDGRYLMFASGSRYNVFDPQSKREFYRYDAVSGRLDCASCSVSTPVPTDHAFVVKPVFFRGSPASSLMFGPRPRLTPDGKILFASADPLVAQDTNSDFDVYLWDGEARLISSGKSVDGAWPTAMTEDASSIFFMSRSRLVGADIDNKVDLYAARTEGGIAAQQSPPQLTPPCQGPACRGEEAAPPEATRPGTAQVTPNRPAPNCKSEQRKLDRAERKAKRAQRKAHRKDRKVKKLRRKAKRADGKRSHKLRKRTKRARHKAKRLDRKAGRADKREERAARRASRCLNGGAK